MIFGSTLRREIFQTLRRLGARVDRSLGLVRRSRRAPDELRTHVIDDQTWFELQFRPEQALHRYGIPLPGLPSPEVQFSFTARSGRINLRQAFNFYRHIRTVCRLTEIRDPRILDFGGGWGRISRFFLRDTRPEFIVIADCQNDAIRALRETNNPCRIIKNEPRPPIVGVDTSFDLICAFSVFSHLSEELMHEWVGYLMGLLRPRGHLVFTTRGYQFIDQLEQLHREATPVHGKLREQLPSPTELRKRHRDGEFQFYPLRGTGELTADFYGETFIPRSYIERHYGSVLVDFAEDIPDVDQSVVVLQRA